MDSSACSSRAVYGKAAAGPDTTRPFPQFSHPPCSITMLHRDFFTSSFYHRFLVQRMCPPAIPLYSTCSSLSSVPCPETPQTGPIIDPHEFASRATSDDPEALGEIGRLVCLVLSTWAASFGVNEKGEPERDTGYGTIKLRRERTNAWVRELLRQVDHYGLLRRPTWDGVQLLLLLLPLTEGV